MAQPPTQTPGPAPAPEQPHPDIREVVKRVTDLFHRIGTEKMPTTVIPAGNKNTSRAASLYFISGMLVQLANARFKACTAEAHEAGILGSDDDYIEGRTVNTWTCPDFSITAKKSAPRNLLDKDLLLENLTEMVGSKKAADVIKRSMKKGKGAVTITTAMK
jgi:hypothetical protein